MRFIPRARGRRIADGEMERDQTVHPACAGETSAAAVPDVRGRVHPRVRGGDLGPPTVTPSLTGSSPRARGRLDPVRYELGVRGFIPACAGETHRHSAPSCSPRVHPRVRGGDTVSASPFQSTRGSSPRARGRRAVAFPLTAIGGFIPACAGETLPRAMPRRPEWVHPRVRGGDGSPGALCKGRPGSSPRARGRRISRDRPCGRIGFIPACAGETWNRSRGRHERGVHPRVRGGDRTPIVSYRKHEGSSPRARGRQIQRALERLVQRFIPACAGETPTPGCPRDSPRVHPRVRGGDYNKDQSASNAEGSSPRARGRRKRRPNVEPMHGFIPACAGETSPRTTMA